LKRWAGSSIEALPGWLKDGKLKQKEDVAVGLENAPGILVRLFTSANFGKQLLKIGEPSLERIN
jgi:NADPH-dependent curcumin reductase CurA